MDDYVRDERVGARGDAAERGAVVAAARDAEEWAQEIRARAVDARRRAQATCAASFEGRLRAEDLQARAHALRQDHREALRDRVTRYTALCDADELMGPSVAFVTRESARLRRDPAIEQAKTLLVERYGISRAGAFAVLRRQSSRRNEQLASVAHALLREAGVSSGDRRPRASEL